MTPFSARELASHLSISPRSVVVYEAAAAQEGEEHVAQADFHVNSKGREDATYQQIEQ